MPTYLSIILFFLGFILLIKGASFLVHESSSIAKRFHVSDILIGLTVVAFGTSLPELVINILASIEGASDLAFSNIVGSNISNILFILGVSSIIYPLSVHKNTIWKEIPFLVLTTIVLLVISNDIIFDNRTFSEISRIDGLVFLAFFFIFIYYTFGISKIDNHYEVTEIKQKPLWYSIVFIILGIIALSLGGMWIVEGAMIISKIFGLSETFVGVIIIAIGTSLPELATSIYLARRKMTDMVIGNVVGSNIINVLFILGISAIIKPIPIHNDLNVDLLFLLLASVLLFLILFVGKKFKTFFSHIEEFKIKRWNGVLFVLFFVSYTIFTIFRG